MSHTFISYVREDKEIVDKLAEDLRSRGIKVWFDRRQLLPGQRWRQAIRSAIREGAFFIACFSSHYSKRDKSYMNEELTVAIDELRKRPMDQIWFIPVLLEDCQIPDRQISDVERLRDLEYVRMHENWEEGFARLLRAINRDRISSQTSRPHGPSRKSAKPDLPASQIPLDVKYSILDSDVLPGIKRTLEIRLNKRVSEETLRALALKLKSGDSRSYERTFIGYYLPDMKVGSGAWATTHFDPELEVRILGLTKEQEKTLTKQPTDPSREVLGRWLDERPFVGNMITIFRQAGNLFMENAFADGSSGKMEILARPSPFGKRFEDKDPNDFGEYFLIDSDGNLQLWDRDGLISTAKSIGE